MPRTRVETRSCPANSPLTPRGGQYSLWPARGEAAGVLTRDPVPRRAIAKVPLRPEEPMRTSLRTASLLFVAISLVPLAFFARPSGGTPLYAARMGRSEEHTSELPSHRYISYAA